MYRKALFTALVFAAAVGCSKKEDPPPPPPAPWGPAAIAVGDDALIMVSGDMLTWSQVLQATSGITATGDIVKVFKVPTSGRLVAIVNRGDVLDVNAEIWYTDSGGTGLWTKASYGTTEANLDARHRAAGVDDDWDLTDLYFVDQNTGYAVGDYGVILWTHDGGATWTDLNVYSDGTTVPFQEIDLGATIPAEFIIGAAVQNPAGTLTGTIYATNEWTSSVRINVTSVAAFTSVDSIQVGAAGTPVAISSVDNVLWKYGYYPNSVRAIADATGIHTVLIGTSTGGTTSTGGVWKMVSNAPTTPDLRTFTITGPAPANQYATGEVGYYSINGFFMFDAVTAAAATGDGIWYTTDGLDWTQFTGSDNEVYYTLVWSDQSMTTNAFLYSIDNAYDPGRVHVTYTAGTPGTWAFDTAGAGWTIHSSATNNTNNWVNGPESGFIYGPNMYFLESGQDSWAWCPDITQAVMNDTLWQDTLDMNMAGAAGGANPIYQHDVLTGGVTGTVRALIRN